MQAQFNDLLKLYIPCWVTFPVEVNGTDVDIYWPEYFIELQSDELFQEIFQDGKQNVWKSNDNHKKYLLFWEKVQFFVTAFLSSCWIWFQPIYYERHVTDSTLYKEVIFNLKMESKMFGKVMAILKKHLLFWEKACYRLDILQRVFLWLSLTILESIIAKLAKQHQLQVSH